jgi:hypothetical protein
LGIGSCHFFDTPPLLSARSPSFGGDEFRPDDAAAIARSIRNGNGNDSGNGNGGLCAGGGSGSDGDANGCHLW